TTANMFVPSPGIVGQTVWFLRKMLSVSWTEEKRNEDILRTANGKDHVQNQFASELDTVIVAYVSPFTPHAVLTESQIAASEYK
ncbi:hypothetical protein LSAT2_019961, partial [Lamellibrachia satsuma]